MQPQERAADGAGTPALAMQHKAELRESVLAQLRTLDRIGQRSDRILQRVLELPEFMVARTVVCYVSMKLEVQTDPLCEAILQSSGLQSPEKRLIVPYCGDFADLHLVEIRGMDDLTRGMYGIREPHAHHRSCPERAVAFSEPDCVFVPGLAFDAAGNRLGRGKGYYDRFLASMSSETSLIGLAFDCQIQETIPTEPHDLRVHKVVTESGILC